MPSIPATIGPYTITRELGRGGMGVVYLATDTRLDRAVAIKALPEHVAFDHERRARFEREAKTLASLNHPNVAGIHGTEEADGSTYLVLEYVEGETLEDRLDRGALPVEEALEIAIGIATGVEAAHEAGVIHRDLKPANIKITSAGQVKVLDFGLARSQETSASGSSTSQAPTQLTQHATGSGVILGTAAYMAPEQARGKRVDTRADIWSLGVILYEMLTGTNPFRGESPADSISAVLNAELDFAALPASTPVLVRSAIVRCLQRDKTKRKQSVADLRVELEVARSTPGDISERLVVRHIESHTYRLSDQLCESLDREGFDALLLGWEMPYADNHLGTDDIVLWIPSFGGDHTTIPWRHLLESSPIRMILPTPVGMEPGTSVHPTVSIENQLAIYRCFAGYLRETFHPKNLFVAGFSCGSIMALRTAAGGELASLFDGVLAIDPDIEESDCSITGKFARLDSNAQDDAFEIMKDISGACTSVQDWVITHAHLFHCADKIQYCLEPLVRQAQEFSDPYRGVRTGAKSPIIDWLREACDRVPVVRCVFPSSKQKYTLASEIRLEHMDSQCLGQKFNDETFVFAPHQSHSEMLRTEHLAECIGSFSKEFRAAGTPHNSDS